MPLNKWKATLLSRLILINSLVILLVILLAGLTLKDYTCYIVNTEKVTGTALVDTLNWFLIKVSILAFLIAGIFHYISVKKVIGPLKQLSASANKIRRGMTPETVTISATGEMKELVDNFNAMSESLRTTGEKRDEMLKDIAHELRTPLTNMNGYLEALKNEVIDGTPALFDSLHEESRRMTRIVELLTELDHWNSNNCFLVENLQLLSINSLLSTSVTAFQIKLEEQFSTISLAADEAMIYGNRDGLKQVFTNLLQNVLDYNTGKSLAINASKGVADYTISFSHEGMYINPKEKDRIFERFFRGEESRSTRTEGAGLGLAIAKSIITAHKGSMGIKTNGTSHTFWISVPLK